MDSWKWNAPPGNTASFETWIAEALRKPFKAINGFIQISWVFLTVLRGHVMALRTLSRPPLDAFLLKPLSASLRPIRALSKPLKAGFCCCEDSPTANACENCALNFQFVLQNYVLEQLSESEAIFFSSFRQGLHGVDRPPGRLAIQPRL